MNPKFRRVGSLIESIIFMISKGSNEIMNEMFPSRQAHGGQQYATVIEAPKTPRHGAHSEYSFSQV